jgi:SAM-dependent methyltransferase
MQAVSKYMRENLFYRFARNHYHTLRTRLLGEKQFLDRVVLYRETSKIMYDLPISKMDALEISGNRWVESGFRSYRSAHYPDYDICAEPLPEYFDIIIAEQVFEHLLWPHRAARNVYEMLRPGGYFLASTPFLQKIHNYPVDCSRWTEVGIKYLLADCGFRLEDIQTWSWGNRMAAKANLRTHWFPVYNPILHRDLKNDPLFPVQVWAVARREAT